MRAYISAASCLCQERTNKALYLHVPDECSLLPKNRDGTTSNDFELYIYITLNVTVTFTVIALRLRY